MVQKFDKNPIKTTVSTDLALHEKGSKWNYLQGVLACGVLLCDHVLPDSNFSFCLDERSSERSNGCAFVRMPERARTDACYTIITINLVQSDSAAPHACDQCLCSSCWFIRSANLPTDQLVCTFSCTTEFSFRLS